MSVVTLASRKSLSSPNKSASSVLKILLLRLKPRSASAPNTPSPIHPSDPPHDTLPEARPPKTPPTYGVNNQSARAVDGASVNASAATISIFFISSSSLGRLVRFGGASDMPQARTMSQLESTCPVCDRRHLCSVRSSDSRLVRHSV